MPCVESFAVCPQFDFRLGVKVGSFLAYNINRALSLQPEVAYVRRGAKNFGAQRMRVRNDYLEVPVLLKLSVPLKPVTPRAFVGPYVRFLVDDNMPSS